MKFRIFAIVLLSFLPPGDGQQTEVEVSPVGAVQPHLHAVHTVMRSEGTPGNLVGIRAHEAASKEDPEAAETTVAATTAATTAAETVAPTTSAAATTAAPTTAAATSTTTTNTSVELDADGSRKPTTMTLVVTHIEVETATVIFTEQRSTTTSTTTTSTTNTTTSTVLKSSSQRCEYASALGLLFVLNFW